MGGEFQKPSPLDPVSDRDPAWTSTASADCSKPPAPVAEDAGVASLAYELEVTVDRANGPSG